MTISYPAVLEAKLPTRVQRFTETDAWLHALSIGFGSDPLAPRELVFAGGRPGRAFPTLALSLGYVSMREMHLGIDYGRMVAAGVRLVSHSALPLAGEVIARHRVVGVTDLGTGRGALVSYERELRDNTNGALLATALFTAFCRGDGGCGGSTERAVSPTGPPERAPEVTLELPTFPQQALLHRLAGDIAPIHADPEVARAAGFQRPLLQGLAIFGMAARGVVMACADGDESRLHDLQGRFSSPLHPGETLVLDLWHGASGEVFLRGSCKERSVVVFDRAVALLRPPQQRNGSQ